MLAHSIDQFHVARGDTCVGCFAVTEILSRVERGDLDPFDHVYDESQKDWIAIIVHPSFASHQEFWKKYQHLKVSKPIAAPGLVVTSDSVNESSKEAWFVLKGDHRFGPFEYLELVRLTQERNLNDWDYVWTKRLPKWARISSLPEFRPEAITQLRESLSQELGASVNEVFFRRRFARAAFESSILVHNNQKVFRGRSLELSAGGLSLELAEGDIKLSDHLHLHVKPSLETPAFNSACEVVTRRVMNAGDPKSPVVYGMKFLGLEDRVKKEIDGWANRTVAKTNKSEAA
jgi:hypothetical protein